MTDSPYIPVAFFGATGGCANACLVHTLKAGYKASALARIPPKLINLLLSQGIDQFTIDSNLTVIQGDATDIAAVKRALVPGPNNGRMVSTIISGLGGSPKLQLSALTPVTLDNPHICEQSTNVLLSAIRELQSSQCSQAQQKPLLAIISTTGISSAAEDVPFLFRLFYHYFLAVPHQDKRKMERAIISSMDTTDPSDRPLRGGRGWKTLRVGTEDKPAVGYTIQRADVGEWIFEQVLKTGAEKWMNRMVTLTN
ncbi:hypothetical protein CIHG_09882 [Coccidioides immitis H538.4]|uniref:Uncharacterized protein n=2 Tax=Coccidioides immitis TaxID=5501 RepID=A0A0J8S6R1_COCIT|nr:hypothetical protein CIRG_05123 [Coccidioides immitis RMSCC 2394]KMU92044.1 hypothetical protein CIHG_09882 [Coccidioides immitis H538.4]